MRQRWCCWFDTSALHQRELLQHQESRAGALQAAPLQHLLQDLLAVVKRSLCGGTKERGEAAPGDRKPATNSQNPIMK